MRLGVQLLDEPGMRRRLPPFYDLAGVSGSRPHGPHEVVRPEDALLRCELREVLAHDLVPVPVPIDHLDDLVQRHRAEHGASERVAPERVDFV